jgi:hypothetical protein
MSGRIVIRGALGSRLRGNDVRDEVGEGMSGRIVIREPWVPAFAGMTFMRKSRKA